MTIQAFQGDYIFSGNRFVSNQTLIVDEQGKIKEITSSPPIGLKINHLQGRVIIPGTINSHSHAFQILIRGKADQAHSFKDWVDHYLYPLVLWSDEEQLYAGALLAFGEMIQNGVTTVGEFYYIHNQKKTFAPLGNRLSEIVIQAAKDVGLRICLLRTIYDSKNKEGQKRFFEPPKMAIQNTKDLFEKFQNDPMVTVLPAPHSLHGASEKAIVLGAELAKNWNKKFHIHLAEEEHDLEISRKLYGTTPLRALKKMGALNSNLVIVHGCFLDKEEIAMLGEVGGGLAYNPISNMALGDGISDLSEYLQKGTCISLGTDGACANNQVNVFAEMKVAEHLQRVSKLQMGVLPKVAKKIQKTSNYLFEMGTKNGGKNLGLSVGKLEPGYYADFIALDLNDLSLLPDFKKDPEVLLNNIVYSMSIRSAITDSVIGGKFVLRNGKLACFSESEIVETVRNAMKNWK